MPPVTPTRAGLLAARLANLTNRQLIVACACTRHPRGLPNVGLLADDGGRATLGAIVPRLRCQHCGKAPASIRAAPGDPVHRRAWLVKFTSG